MLTQRDLRHAIRALGIHGAPLCVHASFRTLGGVANGPASLLDAFLREACTLLIPTFSWSYAAPPSPDLRFARNGWNYDAPGSVAGRGRVYTTDARDVDPDMGVLARAVLAHADHVRGEHPLCSFTAVGPLAADLIGPQRPLDVYAPLRALVELEGFALLIGVGLEKLTLLHLAENAAGRALFRRWANGPEGQTEAVEVGGCSAGFGKFEPVLAGLARSTPIGHGLWRAFPAGPALRRATLAVRADPGSTHCADPGCERCNDAVAGGPLLP